MTLTTKLTQVIQKNREKINDSQKYYIISGNNFAFGKVKQNGDIQSVLAVPFNDMHDADKIAVLMWVIKICPEEFRDYNPEYIEFNQKKDKLYKEANYDFYQFYNGLNTMNPKTIGEALKQAAYNTCMTYQALEEYYEELSK